MKLEDQVCSLELAKRLKELGVKQESFAYWHKNHASVKLRLDRDDLGTDWSDNQINSAFTVAELGEMLPMKVSGDFGFLRWLRIARVPGRWVVGYVDEGAEFEFEESAETEADTRAKMLIYLIENRLVKP